MEPEVLEIEDIFAIYKLIPEGKREKLFSKPHTLAQKYNLLRSCNITYKKMYGEDNKEIIIRMIEILRKGNSCGFRDNNVVKENEWWWKGCRELETKYHNEVRNATQPHRYWEITEDDLFRSGALKNIRLKKLQKGEELF
jgi:hypothetical protein